MRIAVFIKSTTFHPNHGGLETQNKVLCEGLTARGHEVTVFSIKGVVGDDETVSNGVRYVFVDASYRYFFSEINKHSWYRKSVSVFTYYHRKYPFGLVISQSSAGIGIIDKKDELGIKVISIAHGTTVGEIRTVLNKVGSVREAVAALRDMQYVIRQYFGRQREYILHSDMVVAVSESVKKALIEETFIPEHRVSVINNGIDPSCFPDLRKEPRKFTDSELLYIGQITKDKGVDFLVNRFIRGGIKSKGLKLAGSGSLLESLRVTVEKSEYGNRVFFLGKLPYEQVLKMYNESSVCSFVFPTKRIEGFPMVLVEAMFAGLPVVAYNLGGVSDSVINGVTGYLVEPGNEDDFINKLNNLVSDQELQKIMSENAVKVAYDRFTVDAMIDRYVKLFNEVKK